ncbi:phosphatidylglycerol lysyltransferase domain-containing protein [Deinococcus sp.]|uniref:phosphatidylglycerol lysyltransferase domain-containing protein n=1 Tax=Deinococcus sp. TaxID=47478 RepID=UPI003CC685F8
MLHVASLSTAPLSSPRPADQRLLLDWHARYALNPSSLAALPTMTGLLTVPGMDGGLGFQRVGRAFMASGEPLAPRSAWPRLAAALIELARGAGGVPCFAPVGDDYAAVLARLGLLTVRLGSTPHIHLQDWPQTGRAGAGVRGAVNRASRDGLTFSAASREALSSLPFLPQSPDDPDSDWVREVRQLSADWLRQRRARVPFRWIFDLQPLAFYQRKRYFEARRAGRLVGLIAASPLCGRGGWYLEDILRAADAPGCTGTALVAYALSALKRGGAETATLGGVPLWQERGWDSAPSSSLERLAYRLRPLLSQVYSFDGLATFKRRFGPAHWENESLALPAGVSGTLAAGRALTRLILLGG